MSINRAVLEKPIPYSGGPPLPLASKAAAAAPPLQFPICGGAGARGGLEQGPVGHCSAVSGTRSSLLLYPLGRGGGRDVASLGAPGDNAPGATRGRQVTKSGRLNLGKSSPACMWGGGGWGVEEHCLYPLPTALKIENWPLPWGLDCTLRAQPSRFPCSSLQPLLLPFSVLQTLS